MRDIIIPEYIAKGEKHISRLARREAGRQLKDRILIVVTVAAMIAIWLSCRAIEFGDARKLWPDITLMISTGWIVLFIYAQERPRRGIDHDLYANSDSSFE